ncbi:DNA-binding protein isoform X1 isoform A [Micractinium conductrix]|nr:DNA-binding protein isoform X1 isoform A [Micractinium conductrix]|eukprot:PSC68378.1 DNA-binding protein isoform X1 isoform A [Micractinium conductrix]
MADDPELEAIRQRRMAQLMAQQGGGGGAGAPKSAEEAAAQEEQRAAQEEQRRAMLVGVLQPAARDRLARIELVKPDKARAIEDMILMAARRGQLQEKVSEPRLIELLEQVSEQNERKTKVTIQRRRALDDDEW